VLTLNTTVTAFDEIVQKPNGRAGRVIGFVLLLGVQAFELIILLFPVWVALISVVVLIAGSAEVDTAGRTGGEGREDAK